MGVLNDMAAVDAFAINAYCIVSALFFSACAYAQLNDPNPVQWFCAYVFGGTVPNLYWMTAGSGASSVTRHRLTVALRAFLVLVGAAIFYKLVAVAPKLLAEHHDGFFWAFMEHEEGRDSCGLLLLLLHSSYLTSVLRPKNGSSTVSPRSTASSSSSPLERVTYFPMVLLSSPAFLSCALLCILGVSVYAWVVHHPEMVAKYGLKHCQGGMFGLGAGEL